MAQQKRNQKKPAAIVQKEISRAKGFTRIKLIRYFTEVSQLITNITGAQRIKLNKKQVQAVRMAVVELSRKYAAQIDNHYVMLRRIEIISSGMKQIVEGFELYRKSKMTNGRKTKEPQRLAKKRRTKTAERVR